MLFRISHVTSSRSDTSHTCSRDQSHNLTKMSAVTVKTHVYLQLLISVTLKETKIKNFTSEHHSVNKKKEIQLRNWNLKLLNVLLTLLNTLLLFLLRSQANWWHFNILKVKGPSSFFLLIWDENHLNVSLCDVPSAQIDFFEYNLSECSCFVYFALCVSLQCLDASHWLQILVWHWNDASTWDSKWRLPQYFHIRFYSAVVDVFIMFIWCLIDRSLWTV